jgi:hypothetical protein
MLPWIASSLPPSRSALRRTQTRRSSPGERRRVAPRNDAWARRHSASKTRVTALMAPLPTPQPRPLVHRRRLVLEQRAVHHDRAPAAGEQSDGRFREPVAHSERPTCERIRASSQRSANNDQAAPSAFRHRKSGRRVGYQRPGVGQLRPRLSPECVGPLPLQLWSELGLPPRVSCRLECLPVRPRPVIPAAPNFDSSWPAPDQVRGRLLCRDKPPAMPNNCAGAASRMKRWRRRPRSI